jgi:hypothetical protein
MMLYFPSVPVNSILLPPGRAVSARRGLPWYPRPPSHEPSAAAPGRRARPVAGGVRNRAPHSRRRRGRAAAVSQRGGMGGVRAPAHPGSPTAERAGAAAAADHRPHLPPAAIRAAAGTSAVADAVARARGAQHRAARGGGRGCRGARARRPPGGAAPGAAVHRPRGRGRAAAGFGGGRIRTGDRPAAHAARGPDGRGRPRGGDLAGPRHLVAGAVPDCTGRGADAPRHLLPSVGRRRVQRHPPARRPGGG